MKSRFQMHWNEEELARAFRIKTADVREYFTDGRRVSFIIERRLKWDNPGWELARSEGAGYDLLDPEGRKWEVRSVTKAGVYFTPSSQVGSGRTFNEEGFIAKLDEIEGFILSDISGFPVVDVFVVPAVDILKWYRQGVLGSNARISRKGFLERLRREYGY